MTTETITLDGDLMLDLILWRRYRRATPGLLERTYDMNYGLVDLGPVIPRGTTIMLPIDRPPSTTRTPVIRLW